MENINDLVQRAMQSLEAATLTDYIGESVSQLEHALQCAYFAEQSGHSDEVILASLFHDIGHFASETKQYKMADLGIVHHEWVGAKLAYDMGFSEKVALLIGCHVDAKRYLAGKKASYYERLSTASQQTLAFQGGPMLESEMMQFENHPYFKEILQVRVNDEKGKELGLDVPGLEYYSERIKNNIKLSLTRKQSLESECLLRDYVDANWVNQLKNFFGLSFESCPIQNMADDQNCLHS